MNIVYRQLFTNCLDSYSSSTSDIHKQIEMVKNCQSLTNSFSYTHTDHNNRYKKDNVIPGAFKEALRLHQRVNMGFVVMRNFCYSILIDMRPACRMDIITQSKDWK